MHATVRDFFLALKSFLVVYETCNLWIFKDHYKFSMTFHFLLVFFLYLLFNWKSGLF